MNENLNRRNICPYVNGICEDLKRDEASGYCYLLGEKCKKIYNFNNCREYQERKERENKLVSHVNVFCDASSDQIF